MKKLIAILLATMMLGALLTGCGSSSSSGGSGYTPVITTTQPTTEPTLDIPSAAYNEIFISRNIIEMPPMFFMMDASAFASVSAEGMIEKMEYGHKDDIVKELINSLYYPISEMTDDQKTLLDSGVKEALASYTALSFCEATYDMGDSYYIVSLHFTDLDNTDHVKTLSDLGLVTGDDSGLISMKESEASLLESGYVKR